MNALLIPILLFIGGAVVWRLTRSRRSSPGSRSNLAPEESRWAFLSYFRHPQEIDKDPWFASWSDTLGRPYREVVGELLEQGYLRLAGIKKKLALKLRVPELKLLMYEHDLKVSGKKEELLDRLLEARPLEAERAVADVGDLYLCTEKGLQAVDQYEERSAERRQSADIEIKKLLRAGNVEQAAAVVRRFNQNLPRPPAENPLDKDEVMTILGITQVPGLTADEVEEGRLRLAAEVLWEGKIVSGDPVAKRAAFLIERQRSVETLKQFAENEFVNKVEIMCQDDSCRKCKAVAGKRYPLKKAPLIPIDGCTHESGCRCCYAPVVE